MNQVYVVGVGPGSEDYLPPMARKIIEKADCLIGARRILSFFPHLDKEKVYLEGPLDDIIRFIKEKRASKKIALLVSGDPGLYSLLALIQKSFEKDEYVVIPGISTLQMAFARLGEVWHDAEIISLHGRRPKDLAGRVMQGNKIFLFTDNQFPPNKIAAYLLAQGLENRRVFVFENISRPEERVIETHMEALSKIEGFGPCVMIIKK